MKSCVYFLITAHPNLELPYFSCSTAIFGGRLPYRIEQTRRLIYLSAPVLRSQSWIITSQHSSSPFSLISAPQCSGFISGFSAVQCGHATKSSGQQRSATVAGTAKMSPYGEKAHTYSWLTQPVLNIWLGRNNFFFLSKSK